MGIESKLNRLILFQKLICFGIVKFALNINHLNEIFLLFCYTKLCLYLNKNSVKLKYFNLAVFFLIIWDINNYYLDYLALFCTILSCDFCRFKFFRYLYGVIHEDWPTRSS